MALYQSTTPYITNPLRVIEVKILNVLNNGAGGGGGGGGGGTTNLQGAVDPNGNTSATPGTIFLNTATGSVWWKVSGNGVFGWSAIILGA